MTQHSVDQVPPAHKLTLLSIQHVLAFYAGAVIVPLLIASGIGLSTETTIHLINADLLTCGLATLIQSVGIGRHIGVRMPIIQGVTTTAVSPIIAIGLTAGNGEAALPTIYGAVIVSGLFTFFAAPYFARLIRFFPPVVTGTVLLVMGTTLLSVSASDFVGYATASSTATGEGAVPLSMRSLAYAFATLATIVLVQRFFKGFLSTIAVLVGLVGGTLVAALLGDLDPSKVDSLHNAGLLSVTTPFYFGIPRFEFASIISMIVVMIVTMVETTGDVFATGEIVGKKIKKNDVSAAIRADGLSTLLGGIMNSFPYTCFAQNVGLVRITRVKSRWVATGAGCIMIVLGLLPKAGALVAMIPSPVLGGASLAMFANVAWVGLQTIARTDMKDNRNAVIVTTSLGLAMLVTFKPFIAESMPHWAQIFFSSGMTIGAITAILLNLLFFHGPGAKRSDVVEADGVVYDIDDVNAMSREQFVAAFADLFNTVQWPLDRAWEHRPFASVADLRGAIEAAVYAANSEERRALINDYPDMAQLLGADEETFSTIAKAKGSFAWDAATPEQMEKLTELSAAYRERFGWPFVAYLGPLDSPESFIESGARRLDHSPAQEEMRTLSEIVEIAEDRFDSVLANANPLRDAFVTE